LILKLDRTSDGALGNKQRHIMTLHLPQCDTGFLMT
jgi:hypothetical protein